ncbi:MAG: hypothetical protein HY507_00690 [Candidatus Zambryskibacteria bacterium]|nr:hypothetical protein [Candidatus Zambryskibacteria bacterium]
MSTQVTQTAQEAFRIWEENRKKLNEKSSPDEHRAVRFQAHHVAQLALQESLQTIISDSCTRNILIQHSRDFVEIEKSFERGW